MNFSFESALRIKEHYVPLLVKKEFSFRGDLCIIIELMVLPNKPTDIKRGGHNMPDQFFSGDDLGVYVCWSLKNSYSPFVSTLEEICNLTGDSLAFVYSYNPSSSKNKTEKEIRQIVLNYYRGNLSKDNKYITTSRYPIEVDMVVGYIQNFNCEDEGQIRSSIVMAMEYFMN